MTPRIAKSGEESGPLPRLVSGVAGVTLDVVTVGATVAVLSLLIAVINLCSAGINIAATWLRLRDALATKRRGLR